MRGLVVVGEVLRALLLLFACVALLAGEWQPGVAALALLVLARWLRSVPPTHVREALESRAGASLRRVVLEVLLRDVLAAAHLWGLPPEAVGSLLEQLGGELRRGRVQALAVELHENHRRERGGHG
jgi:hypothetical protein